MRVVRNASIPLRFLWLLLAIFLFKGVVISLVSAPFSGHDEVAHYAYLKIFAEEGRVPLIPEPHAFDRAWRESPQNRDWDQIPDGLYKYAANPDSNTSFTTRDWWGGYADPVRAVTYGGLFLPSGWVYTGNHPPVYYILMTPVYHLVKSFSMDQQIYFLRIATIPFGMLTVIFSYLTVRTLFPRDRFLAMTVPTFVAFQPQIAYESAMLNNDILAIMFTSLVVWLLVLGLRKRFPWWICMAIGVACGFAILSKSTSVTVAALIGIAMSFGIGIRRIKEWLPKGLLTGGITGVMVAPWAIYMYREYGDFTALARVKELQWWNYGGGQGPSFWSMVKNPNFHWERWQETWGAFGWRRIQLDAGDPGHGCILHLLLFVTFLGVIGLGVYAIRFLRDQREISRRVGSGESSFVVRASLDETLSILPWQVTGILTMGVACVLGYYTVLQFGTSFALTQARYYFPMIVPAAVLLMLGFRSWVPHRYLSWLAAAIFLGCVVLNIFIYSAYVIPYWQGHPAGG